MQKDVQAVASRGILRFNSQIQGDQGASMGLASYSKANRDVRCDVESASQEWDRLETKLPK